MILSVNDVIMHSDRRYDLNDNCFNSTLEYLNFSHNSWEIETQLNEIYEIEWEPTTLTYRLLYGLNHRSAPSQRYSDEPVPSRLLILTCVNEHGLLVQLWKNIN